MTEESAPETILVAVAWPYANGHLHAGQIAGAYLPADIYARYHRMRGNRTLMVSGSDAHGTPVTVRAESEGITPSEVFERYHTSFLDTFERFGITFDLFTSTDTANHAAVTQDMFLKLLANEYLYEAEQTLLYDPKVERFLPDRYVEGTCPHCGFEKARGDQCDNCGRTLDALELIDPRSKVSDATPVPRKTTHHFLKLSAFNDRLTEWVEQQEHWRPAVRNFTLGMLREGLHDRAITRDIAWGVPVPLEGYESKRIYVWFEAVIGYLSATKEWAVSSGDPEAWKAWWQDPQARTVYFQGKDNVPFHTVIWPAMLMGYGGLNLPYDVPANQYVTISGSKASTSGNWAVWMPDYLDRHDPDPLRYALTVLMPETSDSDFSWAEYVRRNNDELVARWGNLVNRVLTITRRNFEDHVPPAPATLAPESEALLRRTDEAFEVVGAHINDVQLRRALSSAMEIAQAANQYLEERAPWSAVKTDRDHAAETLHTAINTISGLVTLLQPFLPFTCAQTWAFLGHEGDVQSAGWRRTPVAGLTPLPEPHPLFTKLDDSVIEEEESRLGK
ncbi:MAG: methionine--tRNA ligase [Chloroflexi bacterium]|nr:methionine--tRNA ligase [Chloroflexota bacterium]MDA1146613.1 methionine--tRNA ligase [Chloroflexota bacterium]MQC82842.1 methionine--tRNA ligase [Chloroflexota bacterium]